MKVAFIDNMNNNFFSMARYFRDMDIDAHLYVVQGGLSHFRPEDDTFLPIEDFDWIHDFPFSFSPKKFLTLRSKEMKEFLQYDILIGCGESPAFFLKAGIPMDIIIPYGSDLVNLTFPDWRYQRPLVEFVRQIVAWYLRRSYRFAHVVAADNKHDRQARAAKKLRIELTQLPPPIVYNQEDLGFGRWNWLQQHDFVVFHHSRHIWATNPYNLVDFETNMGSKRNDRVIRSFAQFVAKTHFQKPILVMFEFGPDFIESKKLVSELGIEKFVRWEALSPRKEIMQGLHFADLVFDQFREGVNGYGGTGLEAMATGVPLVTYTNGAKQDKSHFLYGSPIIDVLHTSELTEVFDEFERNPQKFKELGEESKTWYDTKVGMGVARRYSELCLQISQSKKTVNV